MPRHARKPSSWPPASFWRVMAYVLHRTDVAAIPRRRCVSGQQGSGGAVMNKLALVASATLILSAVACDRNDGSPSSTQRSSQTSSQTGQAREGSNSQGSTAQSRQSTSTQPGGAAAGSQSAQSARPSVRRLKRIIDVLLQFSGVWPGNARFGDISLATRQFMM